MARGENTNLLAMNPLRDSGEEDRICQNRVGVVQSSVSYNETITLAFLNERSADKVKVIIPHLDCVLQLTQDKVEIHN